MGALLLALHRVFFCEVDIPVIGSEFHESARGQNAVAVLERGHPHTCSHYRFRRQCDILANYGDAFSSKTI